ncbi:hypothetical protein JKA74_14120 [Marivirga sp. S37H4]|uniref:Uncharacterized protein n=1 Tax=Marivirga aurantiaca TaxID=2802615 RepID=A0A934X0C8_9BACT|nr:hypothetical protein [Marivirga aurantiaca]MBK6266177.1 hypothetical protein [Marivirga aurantiaca]
MRNPKTYRKEQFSKWLLTVTLLLGIFSFSGYAGNSQVKVQQLHQTEQLFSFQSQRTHKTISFYHSCEGNSPVKPLLSNRYQAILWKHAGESKVNYVNHQQLYRLTKSECSVYFNKTIPASSPEDLFTSLVG